MFNFLILKVFGFTIKKFKTDKQKKKNSLKSFVTPMSGDTQLFAFLYPSILLYTHAKYMYILGEDYMIHTILSSVFFLLKNIA